MPLHEFRPVSIVLDAIFNLSLEMLLIIIRDIEQTCQYGEQI